MKFIPPPFDIELKQDEIKGYAFVVLFAEITSQKPTNPPNLFKVVKKAQSNGIEHTAIWFSKRFTKDKNGRPEIGMFNTDELEKEKKEIAKYLKKPFWIVSSKEVPGFLSEDMSNKFIKSYLDNKQYGEKSFSQNYYQLKCQLCPVVDDNFEKIGKCVEFVV